MSFIVQVHSVTFSCAVESMLSIKERHWFQFCGNNCSEWSSVVLLANQLTVTTSYLVWNLMTLLLRVAVLVRGDSNRAAICVECLSVFALRFPWLRNDISNLRAPVSLPPFDPVMIINITDIDCLCCNGYFITSLLYWTFLILWSAFNHETFREITPLHYLGKYLLMC
jgi:hypothetical protein